MVHPNLAYCTHSVEKKHRLSLSHWHLTNLRISSGAVVTPRGTVAGDKILVASLRSNPKPSGGISGGSELSAFIQVQAYK